MLMCRLTALLDANQDVFAKELGDTVEMVENMASPRYIKSHLPWDLLPEQMAIVKPRVSEGLGGVPRGHGNC